MTFIKEIFGGPPFGMAVGLAPQLSVTACNPTTLLRLMTVCHRTPDAEFPAVRVGVRPRSAVAAMVHVERTVQPDMATHAQYQPFFHAYTRTYPALKPILHQQGAGSALPRPLAAPAAAGALQPRVAPSLLAADQAALGADCKRMQQEGADWLHVVRCRFVCVGRILYARGGILFAGAR